MSDKRDGLVTYPGWKGGMNNVAPLTDTPRNQVALAQNVDFHDSGAVTRRLGFTKIYAGAPHSLFTTPKHLTYFVEDYDLKLLMADYTARVIKAGLQSNSRASYAYHNGETFFSNGTDVLRIRGDVVRDWGMDSPVYQPLVSFVAGALQSGSYQAVITHVNDEEEESGAIEAVQLSVASDNSGIQLSNMDTNYSQQVYLSPVNGSHEELYWQGESPAGSTSLTIRTFFGKKRLQTQFLDRPPPATIVRSFKSHLVMAVGNMVVFTRAMFPHLVDYEHDAFHFSEPVTMIEPVEDGLYIGADRVYWLGGTDLKEMRQVPVSKYRVVPFASKVVQGSIFDVDVFGNIAVWFDEQGFSKGLPGGEVRHSFEDKIAVPNYASGAMMLREERGIRQVVTSLEGKSSSPLERVKGSDYVSVAVIPPEYLTVDGEQITVDGEPITV